MRREVGMASCRLCHGQSALLDPVGGNSTDSGKAGSKSSILIDGRGGLLSVVVAGSNVHDTKLQAIDLNTMVVERPVTGIQHLCIDKEYDNPTGHQVMAAHGYRGHVRLIGEQMLDATRVKRHPARRWALERTLAWLSKYPAILILYDEKASNYVGLIQVTGALIWYRRQHLIKH